jgi:hypothetical protein
LAGQTWAAGCDDACLKRIAQQYLAQLVKHTPGTLPVASDINAQENTDAVKLGDGSWKSVTQVLSGYLFADSQTGQVVWAGGVKHGSNIGAMFLRLKVVNGRITESELLTRGGEPSANGSEPTRDMSGLAEPDILYDATVPPERRSTRQQLVSVVDGYLQAISKHDGSIPKFSYRCDRYNAGSKWTNNPDNPESRGGGSCGSSLNGLKGQGVVNVRYAVLDPVHGVVACLFIIPHGEAKPQRSTNVAELFKIVDGKIRSIEEFGGGGKFPPTSGFPDQPAPK